MNDKQIHLSEDEDVERAKAWWNNNGTSIVAGIVIGLAIVIGYNFWTGQKAQKAAAASFLYETLISEESEGGESAAMDALTAEFGESVYAQLALLRQAKQWVKNDDASAAIESLTKVMSGNPEWGIASVAAMRLASLYIGQEQLSEANTLLDSPLLANQEYAARVNELKGDVLLQAGSFEEAKQAYQKSIDALTKQNQSTSLVQLKLENI